MIPRGHITLSTIAKIYADHAAAITLGHWKLKTVHSAAAMELAFLCSVGELFNCFDAVSKMGSEFERSDLGAFDRCLREVGSTRRELDRLSNGESCCEE